MCCWRASCSGRMSGCTRWGSRAWSTLSSRGEEVADVVGGRERRRQGRRLTGPDVDGWPARACCLLRLAPGIAQPSMLCAMIAIMYTHPVCVSDSVASEQRPHPEAVRGDKGRRAGCHCGRRIAATGRPPLRMPPSHSEAGLPQLQGDTVGPLYSQLMYRLKTGCGGKLRLAVVQCCHLSHSSARVCRSALASLLGGAAAVALALPLLLLLLGAAAGWGRAFLALLLLAQAPALVVVTPAEERPGAEAGSR